MHIKFLEQSLAPSKYCIIASYSITVKAMEEKRADATHVNSFQ